VFANSLTTPSPSGGPVVLAGNCASLVLISLLVLSARSGACAAATYNRPAVLDLPAASSSRCLQGVLLGIAKAGDRLVAVGERGCIIYTDDAGRSWKQARSPVSVTLTAVDFPSPLQGWAAGHLGVVLHTTDGGATWGTQLDGIAAARLRLNQVASSSAISAPHMPTTPDARGSALEAAQELVEDGPDKPFLSIHFENERAGLVVGAYGLAYRTADAGKTWEPWQDHIDNPDGQHLYAIFSRVGSLLLVGEQGYLARSKDGGVRFVRQKTSYSGTLFGVETEDGLHLVAYGLRGNASYSPDGGDTWEVLDTGVNGAIDGSCVLREGQYALVTDRGELLISMNRGRTLRAVPVEHAFPFSGIVQAADGTLVAVGARGASRLNVLLPATK
jgi:photosystem II stability/assembly factor-like uncharacterized protein